MKKEKAKPVETKKSNEKERWQVSKKVASLEKDVANLELAITELKMGSEQLDYADHSPPNT